MMESMDGSGSKQRHRMIARVAQILDLVARQGAGLTLTEIAQELTAPVSSVQGLVNGLVETGYLTKRARRYTLGPAPYVLNLIARRPLIRTVSRADLESLHRKTGQTVLLGVVVGGAVMYLDHVTNDPRFAFLAETHAPRPLLRTACGRVLLANMERREQHDLLRREPAGSAALVEQFLQELPAIRVSDLATTRGMAGPDYWTVATPLREDGQVVAAIGLSGTPDEMDGRMDELGTVLLEHVPAWSSRGVDGY
jgi:DNA-binding IclR family transcriptional regulator